MVGIGVPSRVVRVSKNEEFSGVVSSLFMPPSSVLESQKRVLTGVLEY